MIDKLREVRKGTRERLCDGLLKRYFGYDEFRTGQEASINNQQHATDLRWW